MNKESLNDIYHLLKPFMECYKNELDVVTEDEKEITLNTHHIMENGKPLFFGMIKIGKRYVSYHLMPVYVFPDLLDDLSPELKKRMQGKSCFNFSKSEHIPTEELSSLTKNCFERYKASGYI